MTDKVSIYILWNTEHHKYYVGKSRKPFQRIMEHMTGKGSFWTKLYPPNEIYAVYPDLENADEDKHVLKMMNLFGIKDVRGGSYCQATFSEADLAGIDFRIKSYNDSCTTCGSKHHFAKECPLAATGSASINNVANRAENNNDDNADDMLQDESSASSSSTSSTAGRVPGSLNNFVSAVLCFNCKHAGHMAAECPEPTKCHTCNNPGHIARDCPVRKCYSCGQLGHWAKDCPLNNIAPM